MLSYRFSSVQYNLLEATSMQRRSVKENVFPAGSWRRAVKMSPLTLRIAHRLKDGA
jgi:hypothetical protein